MVSVTDFAIADGQNGHGLIVHFHVGRVPQVIDALHYQPRLSAPETVHPRG